MADNFNDYCYAAYAFNNATEKLKYIPKGNIKDKFNDIPCVINCTLTIELAVKAILIFQGCCPEEKSFRVHELKKLFTKLQTKHRQKILDELKQKIPTMTDSKFEQLLEQHNKYFVDLRYPNLVYGKEVNEIFMSALRLSCIQYLHSLQNK